MWGRGKWQSGEDSCQLPELIFLVGRRSGFRTEEQVSLKLLTEGDLMALRRRRLTMTFWATGIVNFSNVPAQTVLGEPIR